MQIFRKKHDEDEDGLAAGGLLARPAPSRPSRFAGARTVGDFVILGWDTEYGPVGWAHCLTASSASALALSEAIYGQFWDHMHTIYASVALPGGGARLDMAPSLQAIDLYPGTRRSDTYKVTWQQLSGILGTSPPWFHWALRDRGAIEAWKPGDPPAIIAADHIQIPARPLLELAADEPDRSPAAAACLWLARKVRDQAADEARTDIKDIREAAARPGSDCAHVNIAAVPVATLRAVADEPEETVLRAGWAAITERRDTLAWSVAESALRWDGGQTWPGAETAEFGPESSPAAAEWTALLKLAPPGQPPTVHERMLLEHVGSVDQGELLHDESTGFPAVRSTGHMGKVTIYATIPQRIATVSPLSEVILGEETVWIRTEDGRVWLAPEVAGEGLNWGYEGSGPIALARLLDRLLDDITAPPVTDYEPPNEGLLALTVSAPQDGVTVYKRGQLLAARAG